MICEKKQTINMMLQNEGCHLAYIPTLNCVQLILELLRMYTNTKVVYILYNSGSHLFSLDFQLSPCFH